MAAEKRLRVCCVEAGFEDIGALIERLREAAGELGVFAQAFDPSIIVSERHLLHAHALALKAFEERENYAKSIETETLLKAAAETRIDEAIMKAGAKDPKDFLLLTDADREKLGALLGKLRGKTKRLAFKYDPWRVKEVFNITEKMLENYSLEELVLERMALSGHEN